MVIEIESKTMNLEYFLAYRNQSGSGYYIRFPRSRETDHSELPLISPLFLERFGQSLGVRALIMDDKVYGARVIEGDQEIISDVTDNLPFEQRFHARKLLYGVGCNRAHNPRDGEDIPF